MLLLILVFVFVLEPAKTLHLKIVATHLRGMGGAHDPFSTHSIMHKNTKSKIIHTMLLKYY